MSITFIVPSAFNSLYNTLRNQEPFAQTIRLYGREYHLSLFLGNPWDILLDKLILPRFIEQLNVNDFLGKDLRHFLLVLQQDHAKQDFWQHLVAKSEALGRRETLKAMLLRLVAIVPEPGYKRCWRGWRHCQVYRQILVTTIEPVASI
jgi:hypothetical protein